jgi:predicted dehydrogenase
LGADSHSSAGIEAFADTIPNGAPQAGADAHDGVGAVRTLVAIDRSLSTGETVKLADIAGAV